MRGDFTRDTRERARRLSTRAILLQQGRQLLDADWNAQAGLTAARAEKAAIDTIGHQGAPREDAGFAVTGGNDTLTIGAGSMYVEGLRCHNPAPLSYASQLAADVLPELDSALPSGSEGLVYLEAGAHAAMEADDAMLPEPALGGADTVVHEIVRWAVRVAPLSGIGMSRAALIQAIDRNKPVTLAPWERTTGGITADVQTEDEATDPGPCEMPATAGYLDQVNRLFRIEIHDSGAPGTATFKWAEDAGAEAGLRPEGAGFAIDLPIKRAQEEFPAGAHVEVITRERQQAGLQGLMGVITSAPGAALTLQGVPGSALDAQVRIRRWAGLPQVIPANSAWVALSRGVKVRFAPGQYVRGSAWSVPARTRTGDILWPPYPKADLEVALGAEGNVAFYAPSDGQRRYAALALVTRSGNTFTVTRDLRQVYAPLTDLTADLVRYDNNGTDLASTDVQGAITELAARRGDHCTYTAEPGAGWASVFAKIPPGANATVCLPVGNFPLKAAALIQNLGHVRIIGSGPGTKIWSYGDASALRFRNCRSVELRDLTVAGENRNPYKPVAGSTTRGAVDIAQCGSVRVERAVLIGAGTRWRQSVCLRIDAAGGTSRGGGDVVVSDCDIVAGDLAGGILVLNAVTARIRDNRIRPRGEDQKRTIQRWANDPMAAASLGRLLFSNSIEAAQAPRPRTRPASLFNARSVTVGDRQRQIAFLTLNMISGAIWDQFARAYSSRADSRADGRTVRLDIRELTGNLWSSGGRIRANGIDFDGFQPAFTSLTNVIGPVIEAGIVVAGSSAGDVAISGNAIDGALQGVRVAISTGQPGRLPLRSVRVERNTIRLAVVPLDRPRHGIYIGNAERAWVVDNDIAVASADRPDERVKRAVKLGLQRLFSEGIRVYGNLGAMLQIRGNAIQNTTDGITVWSFSNPSGALRLLDGNMILNASTPLRFHGTTPRQVNNMPVGT